MTDDIKKFVRFLKSKGAFGKFVEESKKAGNKTIDATLSLCTEDPRDLLTYAFYWERTADGAEYWEQLDFEWCELIDNESK